MAASIDPVAEVAELAQYVPAPSDQDRIDGYVMGSILSGGGNRD